MLDFFRAFQVSLFFGTVSADAGDQELGSLQGLRVLESSAWEELGTHGVLRSHLGRRCCLDKKQLL